MSLATSVECFIDTHVFNSFKENGLDDSDVETIVRRFAKKEKIEYLNKSRQNHSKAKVNKTDDELNNTIFKYRNQIAHGRASPDSIDAETVKTALQLTLAFLWDWGLDADRRELFSLECMSQSKQFADSQKKV